MLPSFWPQCYTFPVIVALMATCTTMVLCYECPEQDGVKQCLTKFFNDTDQELPTNLQQILAPNGRRRKRRSVPFHQEHCNFFSKFIACTDQAVPVTPPECATMVEDKLCKILNSFFVYYDNPICDIGFQQWRTEDGHRECVTQQGSSGQAALAYPSLFSLLVVSWILYGDT